jgi:hypothetical protein
LDFGLKWPPEENLCPNPLQRCSFNVLWTRFLKRSNVLPWKTTTKTPMFDLNFGRTLWRCSAFFGVLFFVQLSILGQSDSAGSIALTGTVIDKSTQQPLIGATILEAGTQNGTNSDSDGRFQFNVKSLPADIVVSYIGYSSQTLTLTTNEPLEIFLDVDAELVGEVLVVGYGRQKKKVSTGSIAKVSAEQIEGNQVQARPF